MNNTFIQVYAPTEESDVQSNTFYMMLNRKVGKVYNEIRQITFEGYLNSRISQDYENTHGKWVHLEETRIKSVMKICFGNFMIMLIKKKIK